MEYSYHLKQRFPALHITAEVQVPPVQNRMAATMVGYAQMASFVVSFFGDAVFQALSMPVPDWAKYAQENKGTAVMLFFVGNMVSNSLTQTGAFEVYLGGQLIHSKIQTGGVPDFNALVAKVHSVNPDLQMAPPQGGQGQGHYVNQGGRQQQQQQPQQQQHPKVQKHQQRHYAQEEEDEEDDEF
uniref:Selenoprotein T n=1 Tax=Hemiselmis tepida TaxID=464990 RepID=A0A7S0VE78_9CRYP|mmetsp:Transcript_12904/g.33181  ORF Transcript_12904/g.33181 Transcript_12904/m.33181 type:complete len:184 (+) Transcript_12904:355-906(+)